MMRKSRHAAIFAAVAVSLAALAAAAWAQTTKHAAPADDMEYWLNQGKPATSSAPARPAAEDLGVPPRPADQPSRDDALPGVVELSNGKVMPGWLYTTAEKPWVLFIESEKRWRSIPFLNVLSIEAVVDEEKMEQEWRWKEMGVPERVYTGKEYPTRRFQWKFHLIDDTTLTGTIKGQPLWVALGQTRVGPMVLHERSKGEPGQKLAELVYVKRILVSRRLMDQVLKESPTTRK
jgi:hypothetical protein